MRERPPTRSPFRRLLRLPPRRRRRRRKRVAIIYASSYLDGPSRTLFLLVPWHLRRTGHGSTTSGPADANQTAMETERTGKTPGTKNRQTKRTRQTNGRTTAITRTTVRGTRLARRVVVRCGARDRGGLFADFVLPDSPRCRSRARPPHGNRLGDIDCPNDPPTAGGRTTTSDARVERLCVCARALAFSVY